jgi:hypothetical protein
LYEHTRETETGKYPMFFFFLGYSDMNSEEQKSLEDFFKAKSIRAHGIVVKSSSNKSSSLKDN